MPTQKYCTANHDVFMQCLYCGWKRGSHECRYEVVVAWVDAWVNYPSGDRAKAKIANRVMCPVCLDTKDI